MICLQGACLDPLAACGHSQKWYILHLHFLFIKTAAVRRAGSVSTTNYSVAVALQQGICDMLLGRVSGYSVAYGHSLHLPFLSSRIGHPIHWTQDLSDERVGMNLRTYLPTKIYSRADDPWQIPLDSAFKSPAAMETGGGD